MKPSEIWNHRGSKIWTQNVNKNWTPGGKHGDFFSEDPHERRPHERRGLNKGQHCVLEVSMHILG